MQKVVQRRQCKWKNKKSVKSRSPEKKKPGLAFIMQVEDQRRKTDLILIVLHSITLFSILSPPPISAFLELVFLKKQEGESVSDIMMKKKKKLLFVWSCNESIVVYFFERELETNETESQKEKEHHQWPIPKNLPCLSWCDTLLDLRDHHEEISSTLSSPVTLTKINTGSRSEMRGEVSLTCCSHFIRFIR